MSAQPDAFPQDLTPTEATRRDNAAQRLADYIQATVAAAPPLTADQRDRLAMLLRPIPTTARGERVAG